MSATCLRSNTNHDVRCPVCGQGFLIFAEHVSATVSQQMRRSAELAMRLHHAFTRNPANAHPANSFQVAAENTTLSSPFCGFAQTGLTEVVC